MQGNEPIYTDAELDVMFSYHPPTEVTGPKHHAIFEARKAFDEVINSTFRELAFQEAAPNPSEINGVDYPTLHRAISDGAKTYSKVIRDHAEHDLYQWAHDAINDIILSRMWANKGIRSTHPDHRGRYKSFALKASETAELWANSAVALEPPLLALFK